MAGGGGCSARRLGVHGVLLGVLRQVSAAFLELAHACFCAEQFGREKEGRTARREKPPQSPAREGSGQPGTQPPLGGSVRQRPMGRPFEERSFYAKGMLERGNGQLARLPLAPMRANTAVSLASLRQITPCSFADLRITPILHSTSASSLQCRAPARPSRPVAPRKPREPSPIFADSPQSRSSRSSSPDPLSTFLPCGSFRSYGGFGGALREKELEFALWREQLKGQQATRMLRAAQSARPPWMPRDRELEARFGRGR